MNFATITLTAALLGAFTLSMADETVQTNTIDAQIEKIQNAPAQERVQLMNEFKQQLINMNEQERTAAISQLQEKVHAHVQQNTQTSLDSAQSIHQRAHEMTSTKQAEAIQHMNQMQYMNQTQAGDQVQHIINQGNTNTQIHTPVPGRDTPNNRPF